MARNNHITNSFVAGEASPRFFGRSDTQQYNQMCKKLRNALVYPQGGAGRRPGSQFVFKPVDENGDPLEDARMIPFYGSDGTRWQLIFSPTSPDTGGSYIPGTSTDALNWQAVNVNDYSLEYIRPDFGDASSAYLTLWLPNYYNLLSRNVPMNQMQYAQSLDTIFIAHGRMRPFKIVYDPNATAPLPKFTMSMYPDVQASLTDATSWRQMPFLAPVSGVNTESIDLVVDGSGNITIDPSSGSSISFDSTWHGRIIKFTRNATTTFVGMVFDVDSATSAKIVGLGGSAPGNGTNEPYGNTSDLTDTYEMCAWNDEYGWPRTVAFMDNRIVWGGNQNFPDQIWFSQTNDVDEMDPRGMAQDSGFSDPTVNTDPFSINLKSDILCEIRWMSVGKTLQVGTNFREFIVKGPDQTLSIGPLNVSSEGQTAYGSAYMQAIRNENTVVFAQRTRRQLREMVFNFSEDSFKAPNLNSIGQHVSQISSREGEYSTLLFGNENAQGYFVAIVSQAAPDSFIWALDSNGALLSLTRERDQEVAAWSYHEISGVSPIDYDPGGGVVQLEDFRHQVVSISSIQKPDPTLALGRGETGEPDELWLAVHRGDYDGTDAPATIFIEKLAQEWEGATIDGNWNTISDARVAPVYMDCAYITSKTEQVTTYTETNGIIGHLPHPVGAEVGVVMSGRWLGTFTVDSSRKIDVRDKAGTALLATAWQAIVGINYVADIVPVNPEVPANMGSSQGQVRRVDQVAINFYRSIGCKFGRYADENQENTGGNLEEIPVIYDTTQNPLLANMYSGVRTVTFPLGYEREACVHIQSHLPFPMHVTHVVSRMMVSEP